MMSIDRAGPSPTPLARLKLLLCGSLLLCALHPARAGWLDSALGNDRVVAQAAPAKTVPVQRVWRIGPFSSVELVPREAGAAENQQPVQITPETLRQLLGTVSFEGRGGLQPLFADDELAELTGPLAQALGRAGPGDDVRLVSSARRGTGGLFAPTAVTARLFVQGDRLQLIVHDARFDFYDTYRGTETPPRFTIGSRTAPGEVSIQSAGATSRRADWLSLPLRSAAAATAEAQPAPAATAQAAPRTAPLVRKPLDAAGADDIERRLETVKRLREKGLIDEDEYQQKRREILQLL